MHRLTPAAPIQYKGRNYRLFVSAAFILESDYPTAERATGVPMSILFPAADGSRIDEVVATPMAVDSIEDFASRLAQTLENYHQFNEQHARPVPPSPQQDYKQRVIAEKDQLDERRDKLAVFTLSGIFRSLPDDEQRRMKAQLAAMSDYSKILGERIAEFPR